LKRFLLKLPAEGVGCDEMPDQIALFCLLAVVTAAIAALLDWRTGHIPNWLTLGALLVAVAAHAALGMGAYGLAGAVVGASWSTLAAAAAAAVPLLVYRAGGMGGGDVKLLAALGALCGVTVGVQIELYAFVVAALYVGARLAFQGALLAAARAAIGLLPVVLRFRRPRERIRFASLGELRFGPSVLAAACAVASLQWSGWS
jgi:prepilin peptidase CpaA